MGGATYERIEADGMFRRSFGQSVQVIDVDRADVRGFYRII